MSGPSQMSFKLIIKLFRKKLCQKIIRMIKKYCQKILEDQQKAFMNYSKRNAKPRRPERLD